MGQPHLFYCLSHPTSGGPIVVHRVMRPMTNLEDSKSNRQTRGPRRVHGYHRSQVGGRYSGRTRLVHLAELLSFASGFGGTALELVTTIASSTTVRHAIVKFENPKSCRVAQVTLQPTLSSSIPLFPHSRANLSLRHRSSISTTPAAFCRRPNRSCRFCLLTVLGSFQIKALCRSVALE